MMAVLLEVDAPCFPCHVQSSHSGGGAVGGGDSALTLSPAIFMH